MPPAAVIGPVALCLAAIPATRAIRPESGPHRALVRGIKITLAVHALGKSLLPVAIGAHVPGLVRIADCPKTLSCELWLMVHPDLRDLIRIRVVMDWIMETIERLSASDHADIIGN